MKKFDVSFFNGAMNLLYGSILFWLYFFKLKGIKRIRQVGSIPLHTHLIAVIFVFFLAQILQFGQYWNLYIGIFITANFLLQFGIGYEYRIAYKELVEIDEAIFQAKDEKLNVPLIKIVGYATDNGFIGALLMIVAMFLHIALIGSFAEAEYLITVTFALLILVCYWGVYAVSRKFEITNVKELELAIRKHYATGEKLKKLLDVANLAEDIITSPLKKD